MIEIKGPMIDAVAMVRRIRDEHTRQLDGATPEQVIRFHRDRAARLHSDLARERAARQAPRS